MKEEIVEAILAMPHRDGDRLPSVRRLMADLQAASATVQRALHELVRRGKIYAEPGKGCFWGAKRILKVTAKETPDDLDEKFQADIRSGFFSLNGPLPSQKELASRYRASAFLIRKFLKNLQSEGILEREGHGKFFFPKKERTEPTAEILLVTRATPWGEFSPASEREMDFIKFVYRTGAEKNLKLRLLGFDEKSERFVDRNGRVRTLAEYPAAVGIILSTMLMEKPSTVLRKFSAIGCPISVWWEHPAETLLASQLKHEGWAFFNSCFGKNPGVAVGRYLLRKGFRRIVYISPYHASSWSKDRLKGLEEVGLEVFPRVDSEFASPWDFRHIASLNGPKFSIDLRAKSHEKQILQKLLGELPKDAVWIPANDEIAGLLKELEEEGSIGEIPYMVGFDNSVESYLLRLDSFDFNTESLVAQMFYHLETGKNDPFAGGKLREISGKVIEK